MREKGFERSKKSDNLYEHIPYLDNSKNLSTEAFAGGKPYLDTSEDTSTHTNDDFLDTSKD
ncbi:hypothetical protein [Pseudoneobacillus sp. C159]